MVTRCCILSKCSDGGRGRARNQVMVEGGREYFDDALVQHTPEAREQPSLLQVGQKLDERFSAGRVRVDAGQAREGRVPDLNNETRVGGEDAY